MSIDRRDFLKLGAAGAAGAGLSTLALTAAKNDSAPSLERLSPELPGLGGRVLAVGFDGNRHPAASLSGKASVLSEIDLATGALVRQQLIQVPNLHLALRLPVVGDLVLPLDGPEAMVLGPGGRVTSLAAPSGMWFSGHAILSKDGTRVFMSLRRIEALTDRDTGSILVLDVPSLKVLAQWDSGGVRPHDLAWHGDVQLLVSHYGDVSPAEGKAKFRRPCLVAIDVSEGRIVQKVATTEAGSLTHIAYDGDRWVCGVPLHYYSFDDEGLAKLRKDCAGLAVEVSPAERWENRLAAPLPALLIDRQSGFVHSLPSDPGRQRRAQSVVYHPGSRSFWISYSFSDVVAVVDIETRHVRYLSGFDLGLTCVRGICAAGDKVVISGELNDLAIVDAAERRVVGRIKVPLYDNPHLTFTNLIRT